MTNSSGRLSRRFFARPTLEVAQDLVGQILVKKQGKSRIRARIVEVEAYLGVGADAASHAHRGPTPRNSEMFETPGRLYVYLIYGVHYCMNVVCERRGEAGAVLLRAAEPIEGLSIMRQRRPREGPELTNGPGKLSSALGVDLRSNGLDLVTGPMGLWPGDPAACVERSSRIGIRQATEFRYRFFDPDSHYVSQGKPSS